MEKKWEELSVFERQDQRLQAWASPDGAAFPSPDAEKAFKERAARVKDAIQLKQPDRVPVIALLGFFPAFYAGYTNEEVMYDYEKLVKAWEKFMFDFQPDVHSGAVGPAAGKIFDILDYKLYAWPGHGVSPKHSYQCLEGEYMKANEYDLLIEDPSYFFINTYLPRVYKTLEPLAMFPHFTDILEMYGGFSCAHFIPFGLPPVQGALKAMMEAGNEALKWIGAIGGYEKDMLEAGYPNVFGGGCKAPFDVIGDTLRGTKGLMMDMYRQPDKLLRALEAVIPLAIRMGVSGSQQNKNPMVFMPLHKGADGFLSDEQFKKFYWPSFKAVLEGLIKEGCVPFPFVEGGFNSRLEVVKALPKGNMIWAFDTTDMGKAKKLLGNNACIAGNMPIALLNVGSTQQVRDYAKKLIETCGKGGGYMMMNGAVIEESKPENVKAMIDATKEFGVYK
jgi:hypothetical protein